MIKPMMKTWFASRAACPWTADKLGRMPAQLRLRAEPLPARLPSPPGITDPRQKNEEPESD